jgi:hypothetical protein
MVAAFGFGCAALQPAEKPKVTESERSRRNYLEKMCDAFIAEAQRPPVHRLAESLVGGNLDGLVAAADLHGHQRTCLDFISLGLHLDEHVAALLVLQLDDVPMLFRFGRFAGLAWVFYLTGSLGIVLSVVILLGVKEMPRGKSEPELKRCVNQRRNSNGLWKK